MKYHLLLHNTKEAHNKIFGQSSIADTQVAPLQEMLGGVGVGWWPLCSPSTELNN
jgi:hypothetical protein